MSVAINKIKSFGNNLPKAEKMVADYIVKNPQKIPFLFVNELAKVTDVSVASVSRLAKKVGYRNFQEFKLAIAHETSATIESIYKAVTPEDSDKTIVEKVFGGSGKSLVDTLKLLNISDVIKTSRIILDANNLIILGMGSSGFIALDAALRFSSLGIKANAYTDSYQMLIQALSLNTDDVAIGISHSGRTQITIEGLKQARDNGATIIGISNYRQSPLDKISDIFLCTAFPEKKVSAVALSSRIDQICLIDALYTLVARHKKNIRNIVGKSNTLTDAVLRLKG